MEIHHRFMNLPTTGVNIIEILAHNRDTDESSIIFELFEAYNKKITDGTFDIKILETFRMVLCYKYQSFANLRNSNVPIKCGSRLDLDIEHFFKNNDHRTSKEQSILYDTTVLKLTLFFDKKSFLESFRNLFRTDRFSQSKESQRLNMKVLDCFADAYTLQNYISKLKENPEEIAELSTEIMTVIKRWIEQEEELEWRALASLLPKLVITLGAENIVPSLWQLVIGSVKIDSNFCHAFAETIDIDKKLAAFCVIADVCFPSEKEKVQEFHYDQCVQDDFWFILSKGLISLDSQQRKQALYLIKRVIEFVEIHKQETTKRLERVDKNYVPFVCYQSETHAMSLDETKEKFFLIFEVLEEKQKHLVFPALSYLPNLAKYVADNCTCLSPVWLRCILGRVVQHVNESVKIFGLQQILQCHLSIFMDEGFVHFFVNELNNTFVYEYNVKERDHPEMVDKLSDFFSGLLSDNEDLMARVVQSISSVSWGPVAIYWILQAFLESVKRLDNNRNECKWLPFLGELVQKSLTKHNFQLRTASQVILTRILREIPLYPSCLEVILNIVTSFPENRKFEPFSPEWNEIADYLANNIDALSAQEYIAEKCKNLVNPGQTARSIVLLMKSNLIFNGKLCRAETALKNVLQNLVGADLRPYADQDTVLKALAISGHLMSLTRWVDALTLDKIKKVIYVDEIFKILNRSLEKKTIMAYDEYFIAMTGLVDSIKYLKWPNFMEQLERLEDKCVYIIGNPDKYTRNQWSYAIKVLFFCRKHSIRNRPQLTGVYMPSLLRYFRNEVLRHKQNDPRGNFASDCILTVANLVHQSINSDVWPTKIRWFEELFPLVESGNENVISPVAKTVYILLAKGSLSDLQDLATIESIIRVSWHNVWELKKTPIFFFALFDLTSLIVSKPFQRVVGDEEFVIECADKLMEEGESVPKLKNIFLDATRLSWVDNKQIFRKAFISCLVHGNVPRRDRRVELATIKHSGQCASDMCSELEICSEDFIRVYAVLDVSKEGGEFAEDVCDDLLEILKKHKNSRYYDNSQLHRLKLRIMQALLVVAPNLNCEAQEKIHDSLCDLLIAESNQPSVRLMYEWLVILFHLNHPDLQETIWKSVSMAMEKRPASVVSFASVIFHVAKSLSGLKRMEYIRNAIIVLLPNCMSQQFNVRLYSQTILVALYEMLPNNSVEVKLYEPIYSGTKNSLTRGNLTKHAAKLIDDFYFSIFEPKSDYNLKTIFYDLPRLTNVAFDEYTGIRDEEEPARLCKVLSVFHRVHHVCRILISDCNVASLLNEATPSEQAYRAWGDIADSGNEGEFSDIQKKIIPWKTMVPLYDDISEISKAKLFRRKMKSEETGIIVVASLIDRPPNIGGLARTCEIFGAKELVIGSLRYTENREFQALSVSAEKWLTITEVKPHLLSNYLLEKQSEGWELVGAEQTAKSTNLLEMVFPKKTILLLGNEKDGIPANLIPILDTCVEIPQNGVVRSLNVHVTGAICIWQYAMQHILT